MSVKQISVFLEHRTGALVEFAKILQDSDINIRAFSIAEAPDFGIARVIVDDFTKTEKALKTAGYVISVTSVMAVAIPDRAGGLYEVLNYLDEVGVKIKYTYAFTGRQKDLAYRVFQVDDEEKARAILQQHEILLVDQDDLVCTGDHLCL